MKQQLIKIILAAGLALVAAIYGMGTSYPALLTPLSFNGEFEGISGDRWIKQDALIKLDDLNSRGNKLLLKFWSWQPPNRPTTQVEVHVCDRLASQFDAGPNTEHEFYLTGSCEPRTVRLHFNNPIHGSAGDTRLLGLQLKSVEVTSHLGLPLVSWPSILLVSSFVLVLTLLAMSIADRYQFEMLLVWPVAAGFLLGNCSSLELEKALNLGIFLLLLLSGIFIAQRYNLQGVRDRRFDSNHWFWLAIIFIGAIALRFYGIQFGLPFYYHPDEESKLRVISGMYARDSLNPAYFLHPTALLYFTYALNKFMHFFFWGGGLTDNIVLAGRIVSALAGSISCILLYLIGRLSFSSKTGLYAAGLLAVLPLHVTCSRYMKEDALLTFFVLLTTLLTIWSGRANKPKFLLLAGLVAGFSASVKYSGILTFCILLAAPFIRARSWRPNSSWLFWVGGSLLMIPVGFLILSPYVALDFSTFYKDISYEASHMSGGHTSEITAWSQYWTFHFGRSLLPGLSIFTACVAIMACGVLLWHRQVMAWYLLGLLLLFYLPAEFVKAKPAPQPERYILPCLPYLALAVGVFIASLAKQYKLLARGLFLICMLAAAWRSVALARDIAPDTRATMAQWMALNVPPQSKVFIDWQPYGPDISPEQFQITNFEPTTVLSDLSYSNIPWGVGNYLVLSGLHYNRYFTQANVPGAFRETIRKLFRCLPLLHEETAPSGTYGFHNPKLSIFTLDPDKVDRSLPGCSSL